MAWITPTETDAAAFLSQRELDAFRASPAASMEQDPHAGLMAATVQQIRAAVRACGRVRMAEDPATIPQSLLSTWAVIVRYHALTRLPVPVGEDRRKAYEEALQTLEKVARGDFVVESDGEADSSSNSAGPVYDQDARFLAD